MKRLITFLILLVGLGLQEQVNAMVATRVGATNPSFFSIEHGIM